MTAMRLLCFAFLVLGVVSAVRAHPHVWVTIETEIEHDAKGQVVAMRNRWTFDEMFSAYAVLGLDTNKDGNYDREELAPLAEVNVSSLKEFDYFTFIRDGEGNASLCEARDYWLEYTDSKLMLSFTLPLASPYDSRNKPMTFAIHDPTNFVSFAYGGENAVTLGKSAPAGCEVRMPPLPQKPLAMNLAAAREAQMGPETPLAAANLTPAGELDVIIHCKKP